MKICWNCGATVKIKELRTCNYDSSYDTCKECCINACAEKYPSIHAGCTPRSWEGYSSQSVDKGQSEPIYDWCRSAFEWCTHSRSLCQGAGQPNLDACSQIFSSCGTVADLCSKGEFTGCQITAKLCGLVAELCKDQKDCVTATELCNIAIRKCPIVTGEKKKMV